MLARALFQDAPIMLLDEPNSHLDFSNQHRMMGLMRDMVKKRGVTALISLHDPNLTLHYCDQVVMLKEGRVIAQGPTDESWKTISCGMSWERIFRSITPCRDSGSSHPGHLDYTEVNKCNAIIVNGVVN